MLSNLVKVWHETLFYLDRSDFKNIKSDLKVTYHLITDENVQLISSIRIGGGYL